MRKEVLADIRDEGDRRFHQRLVKSQILVALYGISSERSLCQQLRCNMLFKWFVGLELDEEPFARVPLRLRSAHGTARKTGAARETGPRGRPVES